MEINPGTEAIDGCFLFTDTPVPDGLIYDAW